MAQAAAAIARFSAVHTIALSRRLGVQSLKALAKTGPRLRTLSLSGDLTLTTASLEALFSMPSLTSLTLNVTVGDAFATFRPATSPSFPCLTELSLCTHATLAELVCSHAPAVQRFALRSLVYPVELAHLVSKWRAQLRSLTVDPGILYACFSATYPELRELDIGRDSGQDSFDAPHLATLTLTELDALRAGALRRFPRLRVLGCGVPHAIPWEPWSAWLPKVKHLLASITAEAPELETFAARSPGGWPPERWLMMLAERDAAGGQYLLLPSLRELRLRIGLDEVCAQDLGPLLWARPGLRVVIEDEHVYGEDS